MNADGEEEGGRITPLIPLSVLDGADITQGTESAEP